MSVMIRFFIPLVAKKNFVTHKSNEMIENQAQSLNIYIQLALTKLK